MHNIFKIVRTRPENCSTNNTETDCLNPKFSSSKIPTMQLGLHRYNKFLVWSVGTFIPAKKDLKSTAYKTPCKNSCKSSFGVLVNGVGSIHSLESVQQRAARFACRDYNPRSSVTEMLECQEWEQGRSQPHSSGRARVPLSSFFPQISIRFSCFSSNFQYFLPHFGPPGGRVAHPGRPWLRHWMGTTAVKKNSILPYHIQENTDRSGCHTWAESSCCRSYVPPTTRIAKHINGTKLRKTAS